AGKFSPGYRILETLDAFALVRGRQPDAEFHVVGDKIHNVPETPGFVANVTRRLRETPGVVWHGALDRAGTAEVLGTVHVASSWRSDAFDESVELSTKVLEYASLGLPALLNPTPIQRRLLGDSYPGYVDSADVLARRFLEITSSSRRYARLSAAVLRAAEPFTFESTRARVLPVLARDVGGTPPRPRPSAP